MPRAKATPDEPSAPDLALLIALVSKPDATAAEVEAGAEAAWREMAAAKAGHDKAEADYQDGLLTQDEGGLARLGEARSLAAVRKARTARLIEALEDRFAELRGGDAESARIEMYANAKALVHEAAHALRTAYPKLANGLRDLLRQLAEAEQAVTDANRDLPRDATPLVGPEAKVRDVPSFSREDITTARLDLWCHEGSANPIGDEFQNRVTPTEGRPGYGSDGRGAGYRLQPFVRTTYRPWTPAEFADPLYASIELPGLYPLSAPFWRKIDVELPPDAIVARLDDPQDQPLAGPLPVERVTCVETLNETREIAA